MTGNNIFAKVLQQFLTNKAEISHVIEQWSGMHVTVMFQHMMRPCFYNCCMVTSSNLVSATNFMTAEEFELTIAIFLSHPGRQYIEDHAKHWHKG